MQNFKAAIFDLDGTLVDSMYVWEKVDEEFLTSRGIPITPDYTEAIKTMYFRTAAEYTIKRYGFRETPEQIIKIWLDMARDEYSNHVSLKSGAADYLRYLKSCGIATAIATSSDSALTLPVLKHHGILDLFDSICYTHDVGKTKSFPDIYLHTAQKLGTAPDNCIVFEDIPQGIGSAKSVGMKTVAVYDRYSESDIPLLKSLADKFIYTFDEMM